MDISKRDIELLDGLVFNQNANLNFEQLKYCLIWEDEIPSENLSESGREFLNDLLIVRGFIHRAVPVEKWGLPPHQYFCEVWAFGLAHVANWPGFKRITLSNAEIGYLRSCLNTPF